MGSVPSEPLQKTSTSCGWGWLPGGLVFMRFLLGPMLLLLALTGINNFWIIIALVVGFLSDVFDGIVARRLGVATESLRVADSWVDGVYYLCIATAVWLLHADVIKDFRWPLLIVLSTLLLSWVIEVLKFGRLASYHAYAAKLWGITLFAASVSLLGFGYGGICLWLVVVVGVLGHLEGIAMTLVLPRWTHDVTGLPHALRLRHQIMDVS